MTKRRPLLVIGEAPSADLEALVTSGSRVIDKVVHLGEVDPFDAEAVRRLVEPFRQAGRNGRPVQVDVAAEHPAVFFALMGINARFYLFKEGGTLHVWCNVPAEPEDCAGFLDIKKDYPTWV